jgi:spermidine synthase
MGRRHVALLLYGSGLCALIYQVAWQREFRLVFGASTAASAAVLAIFIGGLGAGSLLLGKRADRSERPLAYYATLELLIALSAAATPLLLELVRATYLALGGTVVLGQAAGTGLRLALSAVVLGVPTFLMGGTLPAAVRSVVTDDDKGRRDAAFLYGVNTLGAVTGSILATFFMLEIFGNRSTLWVACAINALVAMVARHLARRQPTLPTAAEPIAIATDAPSSTAAVPVWLTSTAAAVVGAAFFLMELVWYRMLGPLLGGTVFTFGLVLACALLGIGIGGALYGRLDRKKSATLLGFAATCLLEALLIALPFALGDRLALVTLFLKPFGALGFAGHVASWAVIASVVVLPPAIVAGFQFPLLLGLLGQGRKALGAQLGWLYVFNTGGAIVGALAGGFGLLPLLGAPGCWRLVAYTLLGLGLFAAAFGLRGSVRGLRSLVPGALALAVVLLLQATGPTAAWRHSQIGVGRVALADKNNPNRLHDFVSGQRRTVVWEAEGVESSVALQAIDAYAFVVNGKVDGNARGDAATQVMGGMIGALLHPAPKKAMVIGLGTGSTAGWLGAVPGMERVDVAELEPAILEVAARCAPVNHDVMKAKNVRIQIGDAREILLTTRDRYDVVLSEPSNPYRAGIASLYTQEFYRAAKAKLTPGGVFLQWVQAYEIDAQTVRTVYATLASVFGNVETWQMEYNDLLLVATDAPIMIDAARTRERIAAEPFATALAVAWRTSGFEGFLGHYLANGRLARAVAEAEKGFVNTDDRNWVEFGFARHVFSRRQFGPADVLTTARARGEHRPQLRGEVDWSLVELEQLTPFTRVQKAPPHIGTASPDVKASSQAQREHAAGNYPAAREAWLRVGRDPRTLNELAVAAEVFADVGDDARARPLIDRWAQLLPTEAAFAEARLLRRQGKLEASADVLAAAFVRWRADPWPELFMGRAALGLAADLARREARTRDGLWRALSEPFAIRALDEGRHSLRLELAPLMAAPSACVDALAPLEPFVPWDAPLLKLRRDCYARNRHPLAHLAQAHVDAFVAYEPSVFAADLPAPARADTVSIQK